MLFATTFGDHLFGSVVFGMIFLGWLFKTISSIDDDGEVKETANEGITRLIGRWLK